MNVLVKEEILRPTYYQLATDKFEMQVDMNDVNRKYQKSMAANREDPLMKEYWKQLLQEEQVQEAEPQRQRRESNVPRNSISKEP